MRAKGKKQSEEAPEHAIAMALLCPSLPSPNSRLFRLIIFCDVSCVLEPVAFSVRCFCDFG